MAKKNVTITIYMSELIYDIQNKTYLTGRSRTNGNNHEEVANMQANDDDENANQIIRSIGNAFTSLRAMIGEYLSEESVAANDELPSPDVNLTLDLKMPCNFNSSAVASIASAAHQYLVNMSVGDWFNITNKNDSGEYYAMAKGNIMTIRESINRRVRPERKDIL